METTEIINTITSQNTNWILIGAIVGCILLIILFRWSLYKWLKWFYVSTMTAALFFIGIGALGSNLITTFINDSLSEYENLLDPFIKNLTFNFIKYGVILLIFGIITIIADIIIKRRMSKNVIN